VNDATPVQSVNTVAAGWLAALDDALARRDFGRITGLMHPDGYWRDLLTFGWVFKTCHGRDAIAAWLPRAFEQNPARDFRIEAEPFRGRIGERDTIEFFIRFDTPLAHGRGYVRLIEGDADAPQALTVLTTMHELKAFPQATGRNRFREDMRSTSRSLRNWRDQRDAAADFSVRDPDVLVIGAGQSGLMMAARLRQMNISTLVIDRCERIGDVWRKRYRTLKLHNEICMNHFPYMPFPDNWPVYIPKDKLADWFEFYAAAMELNVWTRTTILSGGYDTAQRRWDAQVKLADGGTRTMHPRHIVVAMGVSGLPNIPKFEGAENFGGAIQHSSGDSDNLDVAGKSVLVVGAGTSAHDIAHNMHLRGARVTMLQRSPITVVSLEPSSVRAYELYRRNDGVRPLADTDTMVAAVPYDLLRRLHVPLSRSMQEDDKDLLDALRARGFLLDNGEDDTGYFLKLLRSQSGYYLIVGASDLIIEGAIGLKAGTGIARLERKRVVFSDGSALDADIVMLATGYHPMQEAVRLLFGGDVADRVGPVWGIGPDNELNAMYARTAQPGLFFAGGGFPAARGYSPYTAMLIKADIEELLPRS
jgi:cation diffusion facilitator CzcD-associated flavoprotein CzcO